MKLLGEGDTPLVTSRRIGPGHGAENLYFKLESCNPSGSYKDRFIAAEMKLMLDRGARSCMATSSGNTGSSLAAYSARYGLHCVIFVNEGAPSGKLRQMQAHGARVVRVPAFVNDPSVTEEVMCTLEQFSTDNNVPLVISAFRYCPAGMRSVESISRELINQLHGDPIEGVFVPVGGGGLYSAVVQGFQSAIARTPKIHAVQPARCSTVAASFRLRTTAITPVTGTTRISGLSVPSDIDGTLALRRLRECGGSAFELTDEEILEAQRLLLTEEGIYCEPAGAAALSGWLHAIEGGLISPVGNYVCLVTGHGFKDVDSIDRIIAQQPFRSVPADQIKSRLPELLELS